MNDIRNVDELKPEAARRIKELVAKAMRRKLAMQTKEAQAKEA